jgi:hypothetical protein
MEKCVKLLSLEQVCYRQEHTVKHNKIIKAVTCVTECIRHQSQELLVLGLENGQNFVTAVFQNFFCDFPFIHIYDLIYRDSGTLLTFRNSLVAYSPLRRRNILFEIVLNNLE